MVLDQVLVPEKSAVDVAFGVGSYGVLLGIVSAGPGVPVRVLAPG